MYGYFCFALSKEVCVCGYLVNRNQFAESIPVVVNNNQPLPENKRIVVFIVVVVIVVIVKSIAQLLDKRYADTHVFN